MPMHFLLKDSYDWCCCVSIISQLSRIRMCGRVPGTGKVSWGQLRGSGIKAMESIVKENMKEIVVKSIIIFPTIAEQRSRQKERGRMG